MRIETAIRASAMAVMTFLLGHGGLAMGEETAPTEPSVSRDVAIDYSELPGKYVQSTKTKNKSCPATFVLKEGGAYKRVNYGGASESGKATRLERKADSVGQAFELKSSKGKKYKINVVPANNGVDGALIGFQYRDKAGALQGAICGYFKDSPASRALKPALPRAGSGKAFFDKPFDYAKIHGAYIVFDDQDKACPHAFEIHHKGKYVRFNRDGRRENGTYTTTSSFDATKSGRPYVLTPSKGKAYKAGVLMFNSGAPGLLLGLAGKKGTGMICGMGRIKKL